jgi:hypothetical protein
VAFLVEAAAHPERARTGWGDNVLSVLTQLENVSVQGAAWPRPPDALCQRALDLFALEDLDHVALADVVVVLEGHAAFLAGLDLGTSSLKRLSVFSVPSWITTSSRSRRTPAERRATPSVTRQPATLPTPRP